MIDVKQLLNFALQQGASDLHVVYGNYPTLRVNGKLYNIRTYPVLTTKDTEDLILPLLNDEQKGNLMTNREIDFGYEEDSNRFRVNVYFARNNLNASFRLIPSKIKTLEELELPTSLRNIVDLNSGLVLVTGPTGEGKSTTIASLINEINLKYPKHILTIEDPIEFIYDTGSSIISQRELHQDTYSWNNALRSALREDPDVVFVGEMRDYESAAHVLTIAETGHLVFSTLHTISAPETINRIIDMFPSSQQNQIRAQLSSVLRTVITQRLMPRSDKAGRIVGVEILHNNLAVANIIREGKPHLLDNVLQTSESEGFIYFEKYLKSLHDQGKVTEAIAKTFAIRPKEIDKFLSNK
jgi:twitching motility protein PilT